MPTVTVHSSYTLDVPDYGTYMDIDTVQDLVRRSGSHFFDPGTMRFFKSRVDYHVYAGPDGWYFVTSEKHVSHTSYGSINEPRLYTVRRLSIREDGSDLCLDEYEAFQHYTALRAARKVAERCARNGTVLCVDCKFRLVSPAPAGHTCAECVKRADQKVRSNV